MTGNPTQPQTERFADDGTFPNSRLPALIYKSALALNEVSPEGLEALFASNRWPPQWRSSVYPFHHYHSTAHECLGVAAGQATLMLGGPKGRLFEVAAGDVIVLPAGVVHRRMSSNDGFLVVGAYPPGQNWDLLRGEVGDRPMADQAISRVAMPKSDPVAGVDGPLTRLWS